MHRNSRLAVVVVIYSPRKTDGGRRRASVSVGVANTKNVICTNSKAFDVDACHPVVMLATHAVDIRRASTSMLKTSLCVKIHGVSGSLDFSSMMYRCVPRVSNDRVREITSILCTLFPTPHL
jgi:hypothetical protein